MFGLAPRIEPALSATLAEMGIVARQVNMSRTGGNPIVDVRSFLELRRWLTASQPDVVFSYTVKPVILGSLAASLAGVKRIYSLIPGLGYAFSGNTLRQRILQSIITNLYRVALHRNTAVILQNEDDLTTLRNLGCLTSRDRVVIVNGSGVDLQHFKYVRPPAGPPVFIFIGRLLRHKGLGELVEAARIVRSTRPEVRVQILGRLESGPAGVDSKWFRRVVEEGVIEYYGEQADVRPFLARASVLVLPSYYREGTPRVILEALASGRPVITTDMPGCRQTIEDGKSGKLIPAKDSRALADAMMFFVNNPHRVFSMGMDARKRAEMIYDVEDVNRTILDVMELN